MQEEKKKKIKKVSEKPIIHIVKWTQPDYHF